MQTMNARLRPNVLKNLPIILFCTAHFSCLLFSYFSPIILALFQNIVQIVHDKNDTIVSCEFNKITTDKNDKLKLEAISHSLAPFFARRSFALRCFTDSMWFFTILRLRLSCSRHAEQKRRLWLTVNDSVGNSLTRWAGETLYGSHPSAPLLVRFPRGGRLVLIFLDRAVAAGAGLFSRSRRETTSLSDSELLHPSSLYALLGGAAVLVPPTPELAAIFTRSKIIARDTSFRLFLVFFLLFPHYANCPACPIILIFMPAYWAPP